MLFLSEDFIETRTNCTALLIRLRNQCPHQEPVDIHEQQCQEKSVEEEVERDARHRLKAGHTRGIQHFEREPVETEPEPERTKSTEHTFNSDRKQMGRVCLYSCIWSIVRTGKHF